MAEGPAELESAGSLDDFYADPDPWRYDATRDDEIRAARLLTSLPRLAYKRTLDIGCGNGFVTVRLPGERVHGCDISGRALEWARKRAGERDDAERFTFSEGSILDLDAAALGTFDLVVITGVLYEQYIGKAFSLVQERVRELLEPGGIVASVHIDDWFPHRFSLTTLDLGLYAYRDLTHRLEIFQR